MMSQDVESLNRRRGTTAKNAEQLAIDAVSNSMILPHKYCSIACIITLVYIIVYLSYQQQTPASSMQLHQATVNKDVEQEQQQQLVSMDNDIEQEMTRLADGRSNISNSPLSPSPSSSPSSSPLVPFVKTHCNLEGVDWYPNGKLAWQQRGPYFLLIGAKKAGTSTLWRWLTMHPRISSARTKELLYFLPTIFNHTSKTGTILVQEARAEMYTNDYNHKKLMAKNKSISFEATPGYLFFTSTSIPAILCTVPWVKLLVTLREPTSRVLSNYNFELETFLDQSKIPTFEKWIEADFRRLREAGVIQNKIPNETFYGSDMEKQAWDKYLGTITAGSGIGGIGRSLYIIQLEAWFDALYSIGRNPKTEFMIVRNEDMRAKPDETCNNIFRWLQLPASHSKHYRNEMLTNYKLPVMKNTTTVLLKEFFKPYNQRLYKLLGKDWSDEWDNHPVYKPPKTQMYTDPVNHQVAKNEEFLEQTQEKTDTNSREPLSSKTDVLLLAPTYEYPEYDKVQGKLFTNQWCNLTGVEWYPTTEDDKWKLRAPYFMLPGAKKSGTTSLATYIMQHPLVERARTKELQFFMNKNFRLDFVDKDRVTLVKKARDEMYLTEYHSNVLMSHKSVISFDATPGYFFYSSMLPQRILCVTPWIKLVLILRNPIDRAYSNHAFTEWRTGTTFPFEQWIEDDLTYLNQSGFLDANNEEDEDSAWLQYLKMVGEGPIGRSLYDVQLRHWSKAMQAAGRDPSTQIYIVRSEDMHLDKDGEYRKVLDFLGLPYVPLKDEAERVVSDYKFPMKNETREMLQRFFEPYNKRLYKRLGGDWDGFWDPPKP